MTCLKDVRDRINSLIEKHGETRPAGTASGLLSLSNHKARRPRLLGGGVQPQPSKNYNPGKCEPWTDKEMVIIAERMMSNYNPAKESIAYREACDS